MTELLLFAEKASPTAIIALLAIVILFLVKNSGVLERLRGTQLSDKNKVEYKSESDEVDLKSIFAKLKKIETNHLHELPEMKETLDRIEAKQNQQGERIAGIEGQVAILIKKI
jgi:hypothetical protein